MEQTRECHQKALNFDKQDDFIIFSSETKEGKEAAWTAIEKFYRKNKQNYSFACFFFFLLLVVVLPVLQEVLLSLMDQRRKNRRVYLSHWNVQILIPFTKPPFLFIV